MSAQPPPYAPESSFPQVKESYQEVQTQPASAKKLAASSNYTPAPPQLHSENNVTAVVTQQPSSLVMEVTAKPKNYLALSIVNMLCCCFILGLIALIFSLQVDSAWSTGNYQSSQQSSNTAKVLNYVGFAIGIVFWIIGAILLGIQIIGVIVAAANGSYSTSTSGTSYG